ncbi:hypothetical protein ABMA27_010631 [Loxostege sticticalis]|uniref:Major facilitator superfamily (MFS) profile domain-containing protein n=1 Tax=Loxostege sticticalis TaxID=481309 RepID=A0ABR3H3T5_LOXSC
MLPRKRNERIFFFRQGFVVLTIMIQSVSTGIMLGFPAILNPAILDPNSPDIKVTSSDASWLTSVLAYAGLVGFYILSPILQIFGRKAVHVFKNVLTGIGWIIFYYAQSLPTLYVARIAQGITMGAIYINVILIGEYADPERRGYFTVLQKIALAVGALICHSMTLLLTWRQVAAIAIVPSTVATILTFFWPESPFYLAMKGRYEECERSFHWLNGTLNRSNELKELISTQKEMAENKRTDKSKNLSRLWKLGSSREFLRAFSIVALLSIAIDLCGRNYFKAYIVQIMTDLTGSKTTGVYISLISDCLIIAALLFSSFAVKWFRRRRLLFTGGTLAVLILYTISLVLYLKNSWRFNISSWVSPCLVLLMNVVVHIGVSPVAFAIIGEIFPLHLKGLGSCMSGTVLTASFGTVLKLTPVLIESIGLEGTYVIYGSGVVVCLVILHFILPETKEKTLLEIENILSGNMRKVRETVKDTALLDVNC